MEQMIQQLMAALSAPQAGGRQVPAPTGPANLAGYDPIRQDIMEKTYAHDPEVGDPLISVGMDPNRIKEMSETERQYNMGSYYPDEDLMYLNPDLSDRDRSDTAKHEFRHRGVNVVDGSPRGGEYSHLEELVMLMNDMGQGIGDNQEYNVPAIQGVASNVAEREGISIEDALSMADSGAQSYNAQARQKMGGGAQYSSPLQEIIRIMGLTGQ